MANDFMGDMKQKAEHAEDKGRDTETRAKDKMDDRRGNRRSDDNTDPDNDLPDATAA